MGTTSALKTDRPNAITSQISKPMNKNSSVSRLHTDNPSRSEQMLSSYIDKKRSPPRKAPLDTGISSGVFNRKLSNKNTESTLT